ncbi:sulfatase [Coraliomargarita sp. W4R53]
MTPPFNFRAFPFSFLCGLASQVFCGGKFRYIRSLLLIAFSINLAAAERPQQPNVLFLMSDDLNTALSGFGHEQCQTPNLDRLAQEGVKFESMHCQYPLCGPSRSSIMSGLYPYTNNCLGNGGKIRREIPDVVTMSQAFKNQGYYAGRVSKIYHMNIPDEIIAGTAHSDDSDSWDEAFNITALEQNAPGKLTNWSPKDKDSQAFIGVVSTAGDLEHADGMAASKAIEILDEVGDEPFFLAVGFVRPHVPLVAPEKYFDLYDQEDMEIPFFPENDLEDVPEIIRDYKSNEEYGVTPESHKGLLAAYYASVSYMDAQVGRVLDALEANGLKENTIVVFTSDHGYLLGHHDKYQKQHLFEEATRVPFIISVPWMATEHGKGTMQLTELIDLYPTLTDLAGIPAPDSLQGTSLRPLLEDTNSADWTKDAVFTISRVGGESLRTEDWRFTQWGFGKAGMELYDLNKDPSEFTNLANNPEYASVVKQMEARLLAKRDEAGYQDYVAAKGSKNKKRKNKN